MESDMSVKALVRLRLPLDGPRRGVRRRRPGLRTLGRQPDLLLRGLLPGPEDHAVRRVRHQLRRPLGRVRPRLRPRENALDRPLSGLAGRPAKCHATSAWFSASTLTANGCPSRNWQAFDVRVSVTWQSAGSREIGVKAVTVAPCGRPSSMLRQLTTGTPVAKSPKTPLSSREVTLTSAFLSGVGIPNTV